MIKPIKMIKNDKRPIQTDYKPIKIDYRPARVLYYKTYFSDLTTDLADDPNEKSGKFCQSQKFFILTFCNEIFFGTSEIFFRTSAKSVGRSEKKFYNTGPRTQYYKVYFGVIYVKVLLNSSWLVIRFIIVGPAKTLN